MMQVRKYLILLIFLIFPWIAYADTATQELIQILGDLQTLQTQFTQTVLNGQGKKLQQSSGVMSMQRPGKFRWETFKPSKQLLIADGNRIWFYDVDLQQVTVQTQQTASQNSPAMLLSGSPEQLAQEFLITKLAVDHLAFKLVPKNKEGLFQSVQLIFDNQQLASMRLVDNLGQVTIVQFSNVNTNPSLDPELFHFKVPRGVDVVRQ